MNYDYYEYLQSDDWKERRKELLEEADYVCVECGDKATILHHLNYKNLGSEELEVDVIAVCHKCHVEIHEDYGGKKYGYEGGY